MCPKLNILSDCINISVNFVKMLIDYRGINIFAKIIRLLILIGYSICFKIGFYITHRVVSLQYYKSAVGFKPLHYLHKSQEVY